MDNFKGSEKSICKLQDWYRHLIFVVYRYRNNFYLKDNEIDLKMTDYKTLLAKQV